MEVQPYLFVLNSAKFCAFFHFLNPSIWKIIEEYLFQGSFIFSGKHSIILGESFVLLEDNLFIYLFFFEKISFALERILFSFERNLNSHERIVFSLERIFCPWREFCFLKREFLSDILLFSFKLLFLRWNRLWNKLAQQSCSKIQHWLSLAQLSSACLIFT